MEKNKYIIIILLSYPIAMLLLLIIRNITFGIILINDTAITLLTISIIIAAFLKFRE